MPYQDLKGLCSDAVFVQRLNSRESYWGVKRLLSISRLEAQDASYFFAIFEVGKNLR